MSGLSFEDYLRVQASGDRFVKLALVHVDMAGDLMAGAMLSRLVYWHSPNEETGEPRLTFEREEQLWLRRAYAEWHKECRLTPAQARGAVERLQSRGLIETRVWKHRGTPTLHLRILAEKFMDAFNLATSQVSPEVRQSADRGGVVSDLRQSADGNAPERRSEMRQSADPFPTEEITKESTEKRVSARKSADALPAPKMGRPKVEPSAEAWELANHLADTIAERTPQLGRPNVTPTWALDMDKLLRLGAPGYNNGLSTQQVRWLIDWLAAGECRDSLFWRKNVRSPGKLREKAGELIEAAQTNYGQQSGRAVPRLTPGGQIVERLLAERRGLA